MPPTLLSKGNLGKSRQVQASWEVLGHPWIHPSKSGSQRCYLFLVNISMQKIKDIHASLREVFKTPFWTFFTYFRAHKNFPENIFPLLSLFSIPTSLLLCEIQKKTNNQIPRKTNSRRTYSRWTDA